MLEVRDHHDRVARGNAEKRDEADERTNGQRTSLRRECTRQIDRQHAANQREWHIRQYQQQVAPVVKDHAQQHENPDGSNGRVEQQFALGLLLGFRRAAERRVGASRKYHLCINLLFRLRYERRHVAAVGRAGDCLATTRSLVQDGESSGR